MFFQPSARRAPMARLRMPAMFCGALPVRTPTRRRLPVADIADIVQFVLNSPVPADMGRDDGRAASPGGHAGDAQRGDIGLGVAVQVGDVPFDQERLRGVREDASRDGQHLDGADLVAAVAAVFHDVLDGDGVPGQSWKTSTRTTSSPRSRTTSPPCSMPWTPGSRGRQPAVRRGDAGAAG
jgi:hypothetical protein